MELASGFLKDGFTHVTLSRAVAAAMAMAMSRTGDVQVPTAMSSLQGGVAHRAAPGGVVVLKVEGQSRSGVDGKGIVCAPRIDSVTCM